VISIIIVLVMGSIAYTIYQTSDVATITVMPRLQQVSTTFTVLASPDQTSVDKNAGIVPAQVLNSTKSASQQGNTTGAGGCTLLILNCKQAVSQDDVDNLTRQIRSGLQSQIAQDIHQQEQTQQAIAIGNIDYGDETVTATPPVGTVSNTVTVTLSLQGSQEHI